jgi:hypothetical protein
MRPERKVGVRRRELRGKVEEDGNKFIAVK